MGVIYVRHLEECFSWGERGMSRSKADAVGFSTKKAREKSVCMSQHLSRVSSIRDRGPQLSCGGKEQATGFVGVHDLEAVVIQENDGGGWEFFPTIKTSNRRKKKEDGCCA